MTEESKKVISSINHVINKTSALIIAKKIPTHIASVFLELCKTIISLNRQIDKLNGREKTE